MIKQHFLLSPWSLLSHVNATDQQTTKTWGCSPLSRTEVAWSGLFFIALFCHMMVTVQYLICSLEVVFVWLVRLRRNWMVFNDVLFFKSLFLHRLFLSVQSDRLIFLLTSCFYPNTCWSRHWALLLHLSSIDSMRTGLIENDLLPVTFFFWQYKCHIRWC